MLDSFYQKLHEKIEADHKSTCREIELAQLKVKEDLNGIIKSIEIQNSEIKKNRIFLIIALALSGASAILALIPFLIK